MNDIEHHVDSDQPIKEVTQTLISRAPSCRPSRAWAADISLSFLVRGGKTLLGPTAHQGPLRVQRPFYPEDDVCHIYLLHPPGGMAPGDNLSINLSLPDATQVLLTTPSAGKIYSSDTHRHAQRQSITAKVSASSCLEWLPQETIVFDGAEGELFTKITLEEDANVFGWDVVCLGRLASDDLFENGRCHQVIELWRNQKPLHIEHTRFNGQSPLLSENWGMQGRTVTGTAYATVTLNADECDQLRTALDQRESGLWGVTQKPGVLLVRYLGDSAMACRDGFVVAWEFVRPLLNGRAVCPPRIWNN